MKKYILILLVSSLFFGCNENSIDYDQIDSMINNEIEANNIPGAVVLIGDEKGINYQKSYGIKILKLTKNLKRMIFLELLQ